MHLYVFHRCTFWTKGLQTTHLNNIIILTSTTTVYIILSMPSGQPARWRPDPGRSRRSAGGASAPQSSPSSAARTGDRKMHTRTFVVVLLLLACFCGVHRGSPLPQEVLPIPQDNFELEKVSGLIYRIVKFSVLSTNRPTRVTLWLFHSIDSYFLSHCFLSFYSDKYLSVLFIHVHPCSFYFSVMQNPNVLFLLYCESAAPPCGHLT